VAVLLEMGVGDEGYEGSRENALSKTEVYGYQTQKRQQHMVWISVSMEDERRQNQ
jgi:hypothetical protein